MATKPSGPAPSDIFFDFMSSRWRVQSVYAAAKLGLFEHIPVAPSGTAKAEDIAAKLGLHAPYAYRVLRLCATTPVMTEDADCGFSLTDVGALLKRDHPASMVGALLLEESVWHRRAWEHTADIVKDGPSGGTGFQRAHGKSWIEMLTGNEEYRAVFAKGMEGLTNSRINAFNSSQLTDVFVMTAFDWPSVKTVVDVGGNQGHLSCKLVAKHPHLKCFSLDLPQVIANSSAPKEHNVADKVTLIPGNFFTGEGFVPAEIYMMKFILHDWSDEEATRILKTIHAKSPANARVVNFDFLVPKPGQPDNGAKGLDVHMLSGVTGKERMESEFRTLYKEAGWKLVSVTTSPGPLACTVAEKI
ncbi:hypothetical protein HK101_011596 [Irineochytrium annulatum]|nr:hypothetical protein HK101_011596 [Irineochytrium annulatum]